MLFGFIYLGVFVFICSVFDVLSIKIVKLFWHCYSWKKQIQIRRGVQFIFPIGSTFLKKREREKRKRDRAQEKEGEWRDVITREWWQDRKKEDEQERKTVQDKHNGSEGEGKRERKGKQENESGGERKRERMNKEGRMKEKGNKRVGERKKWEGEQERSWNRKRWQARKIERTMLRRRDGIKEWSREEEWQLVLFTQFSSISAFNWLQIYIEHILYVEYFTYFIYQIKHLLNYRMLLFV